MSQGLIPVTYPVGIAPEIIQNGKNGYLVHSQAEGKQAIEHLLHLSQANRLRFAQAAQKTSRQFDAKTISERLFAVYNCTLKNSQPNEAPSNRAYFELQLWLIAHV